MEAKTQQGKMTEMKISNVTSRTDEDESAYD